MEEAKLTILIIQLMKEIGKMIKDMVKVPSHHQMVLSIKVVGKTILRMERVRLNYQMGTL